MECPPQFHDRKDNVNNLVESKQFKQDAMIFKQVWLFEYLNLLFEFLSRCGLRKSNLHLYSIAGAG